MGRRPKDFSAAVRMYEQGASLQQVAVSHGVTRQSMWVVLKSRGVVFRSQLRFGKDNHFYRQGEPYDHRVHAIVTKAIAGGQLVPAECESCSIPPGDPDPNRRIEAHHDDYNLPLVVRWLCQACHQRWHQSNAPIRRTVELPPMDRQTICSMGGKRSWANRSRGEQQLAAARKSRLDAINSPERELTTRKE